MFRFMKSTKRKSRLVTFASFALFLMGAVMFLSIAEPAFAKTGSGGGGGMPWESGLQTVRDSIKGPVAVGVSLIAIVASGVMLVFGGDMQGFMRTGAYLALVIGLIVAAENILSTLYKDAAFIAF